MRSGVYPQSLLDALAGAPGAPAFEHGSRVLTRAELLDLVGRFRGGLRAAGLGRGSGLGVSTAVTPDAFALHLAALTLGCRVLGLRPGLSAGQLPAALAGLDALVLDHTTDTPDLRTAAGATQFLCLGPDLLGGYEEPVATGDPAEVALLILTSGSTGTPKRAALTYGALTTQWSWNPETWTAPAIRLAEAFRRFLLFGTLSSAVMQEFLGLCLCSGGTAVIPQGLPDFPAVIEDLRITASMLTVPRLHHVLDTLRSKDVDLSTLRALIISGSPLAPHRLTEAYQRIGPAIHQAYGQTEIGLLTLLTPTDVAAHPDTIRSVGRPYPAVTLEIRDPEHNPVPAGTSGEIWVKAAYQTVGYWNDSAQSREILQDGWLRTRDLGRLDENGYLYLTGRARDVVIVNAIIHYAGAIEQALASHPDVDQAYVVGAPDERTGEAAHAFVVPVRGRVPDLASLRARVAAELGAAAVPATISVRESVPVAASGKPDKRALLTELPRH
ncbi:class I adenylate-forming enzyme family protein [Crossiella sp. CA198]|uniref:class I adenylate-forming enzyme family protein n=1 Tax=Crossiella sp. CA198 TaxID=3455607 RepID=UPI003F8D3376